MYNHSKIRSHIDIEFGNEGRDSSGSFGVCFNTIKSFYNICRKLEDLKCRFRVILTLFNDFLNETSETQNEFFE